MIILAEAGIDIFNRDKDGNNALHISIIQKKKAAFEVLIQSNFPTELRNYAEFSAL